MRGGFATNIEFVSFRPASAKPWFSEGLRLGTKARRGVGTLTGVGFGLRFLRGLEAENDHVGNFRIGHVQIACLVHLGPGPDPFWFLSGEEARLRYLEEGIDIRHGSNTMFVGDWIRE
jgi:hypothetical protein